MYLNDFFLYCLLVASFTLGFTTTQLGLSSWVKRKLRDSLWSLARLRFNWMSGVRIRHMLMFKGRSIDEHLLRVETALYRTQKEYYAWKEYEDKKNISTVEFRSLSSYFNSLLVQQDKLKMAKKKYRLMLLRRRERGCPHAYEILKHVKW